jgi:hypothetical protein
MKKLLLTIKSDVTEKHLKVLYRTSYNKIVLLTNKKIDSSILENQKRIQVIVCEDDLEIYSQIDLIYEKFSKRYLILPHGVGEDNSKFSIYIYNKSFNTTVDPEIFTEKAKMNAFLEEVSDKESMSISYKNLMKIKYSEIQKKFGDTFIIKPTNAVASVLNFKITSEESFLKAVEKFTDKFEYIIEEYMEGNLYAIDFFFDGDKTFILCYTREMTFSEIMGKLSKDYLKKYGLSINENYMHFLPVQYTLDINKLPTLVKEYLLKVSQKLSSINYRGLVHLEYKYDKKKSRIGFIEWGARNGGYRNNFLRQMHHMPSEQLPYEIIGEENYAHFKEKDSMYYLLGRDYDKNYVFMKTNPMEKMNLVQILRKQPNFLNKSFEEFIKEIFWDSWKIKLGKIEFLVKTDSTFSINPFYTSNDSKFVFIFELDEENFNVFRKNKYPIIEKFVFYDY